MQMMRRLKEEGVAYVSLALIPFLRGQTAVKGDSGIARYSAWFAWKYLSRIYDFQGLYHFRQFTTR